MTRAVGAVGGPQMLPHCWVDRIVVLEFGCLAVFCANPTVALILFYSVEVFDSQLHFQAASS